MLKKSQAWLDRQSGTVQIIVIVGFVFLVRTFGFGLYQVPTGSMETTMLVGERFFADKLTVWFTPIKRGEVISFNTPQGKKEQLFDYSENPLVNAWQRYVWGPSNWTKRVIGIPGDHIVGKVEDGKAVVYLNGEKLDEPYLNKYPLVAAFNELPSAQSAALFSNPTYHYYSFDPKKAWADQPFYGKAIQPAQLIRNIPQLPILPPVTEKMEGLDADHMARFEADNTYDVTLGENQYWVMGDNRMGSWDSRMWGPLDGRLIHGRIKLCIFSLDSLNGWWILDLLAHPISFWSQMRWNRCLKWVK